MGAASQLLSAAAESIDDILTVVNDIRFINFASLDKHDKRWSLKLFAVGSGHFERIFVEKAIVSLDFHFTLYTEIKCNWILKVRHEKMYIYKYFTHRRACVLI